MNMLDFLNRGLAPNSTTKTIHVGHRQIRMAYVKMIRIKPEARVFGILYRTISLLLAGLTIVNENKIK
jgi:hypothetical protein